MKTRLSRHRLLPRPTPERMPLALQIGCWALLPGLLGVFVAKASAAMLCFTLCFALFAVIANRFESRRCRRLSAARPGESICSFARAFDCRRIEPVIIRAAWEEVQGQGLAFPVRPSDRFDHELAMHDEDWFEMVETVAARSGRSMDDEDSLPLGSVNSLRELVNFVSYLDNRAASGASSCLG